jgi:hypothetical protein
MYFMPCYDWRLVLFVLKSSASRMAMAMIFEKIGGEHLAPHTLLKPLYIACWSLLEFLPNKSVLVTSTP